MSIKYIERIKFWACFFCLVLPVGIFSVEPPFYADKDRAAVEGYDVTTYFLDSPPQKGSEEFKTWQEGALWYFKNEENLEKFEEDPYKYIPKYQGYCGWALIDGGRLQPGRAKHWTIIDGKLFLLCSDDTLELFLQYPRLNVLRADRSWYKLFPRAIEKE